MNPRVNCLSLFVTSIVTLGCAQPTIEFAGAYEPSLEADDCTWDGSAGNKLLLEGAMNVAVARSYPLVMKLRVANNDGIGSWEDLLLSAGEFSYTCKDTAAICAGFRAPQPTEVQFAGILPAGKESSFLFAPISSEAFEAIRDWATEVPATIVVSVKFRGDFGESASIEFPLVVYNVVPSPCPLPALSKIRGCPALFGINGNDHYVCEDP